ncbi:MAG: AAA family ATPase [Myxococcota bacterium]
MSLPLSRELSDVLDEAKDISDRVGQVLSSAHVLLALFTVPNRAAVFLEDRDITVEALLERLDTVRGESPAVLQRIQNRGARIANGSRADSVSSLHLLAALVRESASHAVRLLEDAGANVSAIRASVMSYATGSTPLPRRFVELDEPPTDAPKVRKHIEDQSREKAPSPIGFHPSLGIGRDGTRQQSRPPKSQVETTDAPPESPDTSTPAFERRSTPTPDPPQPDIDGAKASTPNRTNHDTPGEYTGWKTRRPRRLDKNRSLDKKKRKPGTDDTPGRSGEARAEKSPDEPTPASDDSGSQARTSKESKAASNASSADEAARDARNTAQRLAAKLAAKKRDDEQQDDDTSSGNDDTLDPRSLAPDTTKPEQEASTTADAGDLADEAFDEDDVTSLGDEESAVDALRFNDPLEPDEALAERYLLDEDAYPNLVEFGRNLTYAAARGEIDRVVGRKQEIIQLIDIVGKRRSNNPVLVGEAGVGKTAIVEGLSREFVKLARAGNRLGKRTIIELELGRLLSGTHLRGSFAERLIGIKDEVEQADGQVIVFLDELHSWMSAGGGGDGTDAAGELKTALARGRFPCIGATTHDEFQRFVESDPAFERRFQLVFVDEPDMDTAIDISTGVSGHYAKHHDVDYRSDAIEAAVRLSHRYLYQRRLPDKAIGVLDLAGSRAARTGKRDVDRDLVATIVAESAGIPVDRLTQSDRKRFLEMESYLRDGIVGHRHVIESVSDVIRRNYAGFRGNRPIGSLLFLGPTGVGKTEMVKVLADFLFHDRDAVVRLDMSEFMESHSVSRMLGAPPGYVGHDQGGQLTEAVRRRPYQVVLLDEIEKAHPDVLNILLQLFDEGQLTDGRGRPVNFSNTLVVMTSNLGSDVFDEEIDNSNRSRIGFGKNSAATGSDRQALTDRVERAARGHFTPELWNRIDEKLCFMPLTRDEVAAIADLQLEDSRIRLHEESGIDLEFGEGIVSFLIDHGGYNRKLGARPMRQTIQRYVEGAVARLILGGELDRGDTVKVQIRDNDVICVPANSDEKATATPDQTEV